MGEWSRRSAETTNINRSLNCKHNLKETEAARFEPWPQVTPMSAPECVFPANDKNKMLILMSQLSGKFIKCKNRDLNGAKFGIL